MSIAKLKQVNPGYHDCTKPAVALVRIMTLLPLKAFTAVFSSVFPSDLAFMLYIPLNLFLCSLLPWDQFGYVLGFEFASLWLVKQKQLTLELDTVQAFTQ